MCSPWVLLHALSVTGAVCAFIAAALYNGKLAAHFRHRHPEVWADLALRKLMLADDDMQSAAMHQYLWRGEHKKLEDATLNSMVARYRLLAAVTFCSAVVVMLVQDEVSTTAYRACLGFP